jgi:TonB family protein
MNARSRVTAWMVAGLLGSAPPAGAIQTPAKPMTLERLKALKSTSNDPSGDAFGGSRAELMALVDAFVADSSLVSPVYLFLAAKTAFNLDRTEDAAFLFYAAQLRAAFDFERYDVARQPSGDNVATYLGFLRQTIGMSVNPAIMREPKSFASVIDRLDRWEMVPSRDAFYPDFAEAKGFKLAADQWPATAAKIKDGFMTQFGRRQARLLNDPEYFAAFRFVQAMNFGEVPDTADNRARYQKSMAVMEAIETRLFPKAPAPSAPATPKPAPVPSPAPPAATPAPATRAEPLPGPGTGPFRVGTNGVPEPKVLKRVEPEFPPGAKGTVIMEVTIGADGSVTDVRILRNAPGIDAPAMKAVRQWQFEISRLNGKPVSVVHTVALGAR